MQPRLSRKRFRFLPFIGIAYCLSLTPGLCADPQIPARYRAQSSQTAEPIQQSREGKPSERPAWPAIEKTLKESLSRTKGYKSGDLITREDASAAFGDLKKLGWEVKRSGELTERMLSSNDEMVRQLRDKQGSRFMRDVAGVSGGFDRLDRLRSLPQGQKRVRELIQQPGGHVLLEYMATTPGGKTMGRQLSSQTRGDFNASTQRIYTEQQLLSELKTRYQTESAASSR